MAPLRARRQAPESAGQGKGAPGGGTTITQIVNGGEFHSPVALIGQQVAYDRPQTPFRLTEGRAPLMPSLAQARAQPSLLLHARLGVVEFVGRGKELAWLSDGPECHECLPGRRRIPAEIQGPEGCCSNFSLTERQRQQSMRLQVVCAVDMTAVGPLVSPLATSWLNSR
jgi:hypothetical protein